MTLQELDAILESITGYAGKVAYRQFPIDNAVSLPFIVYLEPYSNNFGADNIVYQPIKHIQVELYTKHKSVADETLVESKLTDNGIFFEKMENYLNDERCYQIIYEFEI